MRIKLVTSLFDAKCLLIGLSLLPVSGAAQSQLSPSDQQLSGPTLRGTIPTGPEFTSPTPEPPIAALRAEPSIQLIALTIAHPVTIRAHAAMLSPSDSIELGQLVEQLAQIDTQLLQYRTDFRAEQFYNLINSLLAAIAKRSPGLSSSLEQSLPNIRALMAQRKEAERQIRQIVTPGSSMSPAPYAELTRSNGFANFEVYKSGEATTGAVSGPSPLCHQETKTHDEYRNVLMPDGFDGEGTALYRNEYHPFPVSETVDVCP